jgi:two-component system response regulator FlrC
LLDEISEMDIRLQAKLLRALQEGEVDRIGGKRPLSVDVRIIATSNRNLSECIKKGTFREDLFYRLNVVNLTMHPLRERLGDVRYLSGQFARLYSEKNGTVIRTFRDDSLKTLESHAWPGNIRELENVIERAVITGTEPQIQDIVKNKTLDANSKSWIPGRTLHDIERHVILDALEYHQGNRTHTAKALGISIRTLRNKLAEYRVLGIRV